MSHFAKVENGIVTQVIVAEQDVIDSGIVGDPSLWIQTSYNTKNNVHRGPDGETPSGGTAMRGNYAGIGHIYNAENDVFYPPSPYPSWVLNETEWRWLPPVPHPGDGMYDWDESTLSWIATPAPTETP